MLCQVQIRAGVEGEDAGLEFHFDKDEHLMKKHDVWCHPHTSTVTYFDSHDDQDIISYENENYSSYYWGAPLVVFNTTSYENCPDACRLQPSRAWVLFPRPGNHVKFNGKFLHGVPGELNPHLVDMKLLKQKNCERISVPVNVWSHHKPEGVERLSQLDLDFMTQHSNLLTPPFSFEISMRDSYFNAESLLHENLLAVIEPSLNHDDNLESLTRDLLPPDFDVKSVYFLQEHVDGSTAHLPLQNVVSELRKYSKKRSIRKRAGYDVTPGGNAGLQITYV